MNLCAAILLSLQRVNQALREVGYQGWGSAEVPGGDRKRLQEISENMDKIYAL